MAAKRCTCCGGLFDPRPQVPDQAFCSSRSCQKARKRLWQQVKRRNDSDYRANQRAAQRSWQERNPDYWRQYRARQDVQAGRAKMDVSLGLPEGLYRIRKSSISAEKSGDLWIIEAVSVGPKNPRKMDASREDLIDSQRVRS